SFNTVTSLFATAAVVDKVKVVRTIAIRDFIEVFILYIFYCFCDCLYIRPAKGRKVSLKNRVLYQQSRVIDERRNFQDEKFLHSTNWPFKSEKKSREQRI